MVIRGYKFYLTPLEVEEIGEKLFYKMLTMREVAKMIGTSEVYLSLMLHQKRPINGKVIKALKDILGVELK